MKILTYQLKLIPDKDIPQFKRLDFNKVEVFLSDVFLRGIHPFSIFNNGYYSESSNIKEIILKHINSEDANISELKEHKTPPLSMSSASGGVRILRGAGMGYMRNRRYERGDLIHEMAMEEAARRIEARERLPEVKQSKPTGNSDKRVELKKGEKTFKLNPQHKRQKLNQEAALLEGTQIPLSALPESGEYELTVRVTDEITKKSASQKLKILLL